MTRVDSAVIGAGCRHLDGVVAEVGQAQVAEEQAAVGVRVGAHAAGALRGERRPARALRRPSVVEELLGLVALHPLLEDAARGPGFSCISPIGTWCERQ